MKMTKRYELVPPDGGWGYVIWIAVIINTVAIASFVTCIGMMYNELYILLGMGSTSITVLNGVSSMSVSIAGFVTGPLLNCMSMRQLGLLAAIVFNLGSFMIAFVNSRVLFFISFGIFQSLGNGILFNISFSILNVYFVKKRMLSVTVTQTVTGIVTLFSSQFVKWFTEEYGYRGNLILISAIYMHVFVAIALMQPVEWHMKKIEVSEDKETEMKSLLSYKDGTKDKSNIPAVTISDPESTPVVTLDSKDLMNLDLKDDSKKESEFKKIFKDFYDVAFLKSFLLSNASIGMAVSCFSEVTFLFMLPQALYFMEWNEGEVAWAISLYNFGDLVTKVIFIFFNNFLLKFGTHEIYVAGLIVAFLSRLGMLWSDNPTVMLVFIAIIGTSRCVILMYIPLVISDAVDKEKFTTATGIFMMIYGVLFLSLGPVIGAIRDLTNSYGTAFYIITSCYGIVIMFWSIELLYKKNKHKRKPKKVESAL
ncbi:monocarboxylate transporter 12-like [Epargyreus clarus]|uniref:monocarboxylate transporter 12-like n=1 Tax=Epargyreus clarus TaxID=520877 RepID=UPI003C2E8F3B